MPGGPTHRIDPADLPPGTDASDVAAAHAVELAVEWIERAFGSLLDAHHRVGHALEELRDAADALDAAGEHDLAARARAEVLPLDAVPGRWTYQVVDEFRAHMLEPARAFDDEVRARLTGGVRHRAEAREKRAVAGRASPTSVELPGVPE